MHSLRIRLVSSRFRRLPRRRCPSRSRGTTCGPDEKKGPFVDLRKLESNVSRALGFFHDKFKLGLKFAAAWGTFAHAWQTSEENFALYLGPSRDYASRTTGERNNCFRAYARIQSLPRPTNHACDRMLNKKLGTRFKVIPSIAS